MLKARVMTTGDDNSQMIWHHLARSTFPRLLGRLVYQQLEEALERFRWGQYPAFLWRSLRLTDHDRGRGRELADLLVHLHDLLDSCLSSATGESVDIRRGTGVSECGGEVSGVRARSRNKSRRWWRGRKGILTREFLDRLVIFGGMVLGIACC